MKTLKSIILIGIISFSLTGMAQVQSSNNSNSNKVNETKGSLKLEKAPAKINKTTSSLNTSSNANKTNINPAKSKLEEMTFYKTIELPKPVIIGGMPLMEALQNRQTVREFSNKQLDEQMLSNLLWAAFGVNREDGKRTAPSAMNRQEIEIFVVTPSGYYFWNPEKNTLFMLGKDDIRKLTGKQDFVPEAGLNLVMVYDKTKVKEATARQLNFAYCDAGYISQNIYLFCASEGLNTVARGGGFDDSLIKHLRLDENKEIILLQTVGFPK